MLTPDRIAAAKQQLPLPRLMELFGFGEHARKSARCPFHEDSSASFSVFNGDDGQLRWKCHAGCRQGDSIDFLARARNLSNADAVREFLRLAGVASTPPAQRPARVSKWSPPFIWPAHVAAFTDKHQTSLAKWRGYSPEFVTWLRVQNLVGLFEPERIAFPVHGPDGTAIGCHYRRREDGSWRFAPTGTHARPLIIGQPATAKIIWLFEGQWDAFAAMDRLGWHLNNGLPDTAVVITRGAENGKRVTGLCSSEATVLAFAQNDAPRSDGRPAPAEKWLAEVARHCGCKCLHVVTPAPHKDLNDWTRAGATPEQVQTAINEARLVSVLDESTPQNGLDADAALITPPAAPANPPGPDLHRAPVEAPSEDDVEKPPAPFPIDALPPVMAAIASAVARTARVPDRLTGICTLGMVSAAIGAGLEVQSEAERTTRANLFLLVSAETGTGKSRTFEIIGAPLLDHQARLQERWRKESAPRIQSQLKILEREIINLEKSAAKKEDSGDRELLRAQLQYKFAERDELTKASVQPVLIAQDATTERLTAMVEEQGEVLSSVSSDCRKVVDNIQGRYSATKSTDESFYLAAYSGDHVRVDRGSRPPVNLRRPCLSLLLLGQPDLVESMLGKDSLTHSGFLQRFLICHSHAEPQKIDRESKPIPTSARDGWSARMIELLTTYRHARTPQVVQLTPEARQMLEDYHDRVVDLRKGELRDVARFTVRWAENAYRVALVLHAGLFGADAHNHPIHGETAASAIRIIQWFEAELLQILSKGRRQVQEKQQDEVLELLKRPWAKKKGYITTADVHRARITLSAEAARTLLARMEKEGLLVSVEVTPERGGKTYRQYRLAESANPVPG